jgi:preprotein translocase subunit SecD
MRLTRVVIGIAFLLVACDSGSASSGNHPATPSPTTSVSALLVFTTWVPDSKVTNGPEPSYKPALSGLTGHDVQAATAVTDATGNTWMLNVTFTPAGSKLFAKLTHDNVAACPGDASGAGPGCAMRHLAIWLELTQADIDSWENAAYVAIVSQPYDLACLAQAPTSTACAKFLSDPITLAEIDGGTAAISCGCTQQAANNLAAGINSARSS